MTDIPTTSTTLLRNLAQDAQHVRWTEFVVKYRPMMEAFMRERFPSVEADDVIQETFVAICGILPSYCYEPDTKGHFRNYLTGILRNKALRAIRSERRKAKLSSEMPPPPVEDNDEQSWRNSLFEVALHRFLSDDSIADRTKRIFERTALNGESPEAVAAAFMMTRHAVDQAKCRAMARLREMVNELESAADA